MNSHVYISLFMSFIAGLGTFLGGLCVFFNIKDREGFISFCLSLSASTMISISLFELIPNSFGILLSYYNFLLSIIIVLFVISICYFVFDFFSKKNPLLPNDSLSRVGILSFFIIAFHNFPEGIATFVTTFNNFKIGFKLTAIILIHNIPEGISIAVPVALSSGSKKKGSIMSLISGLFEPLGAIIGYILLKDYLNRFVMNIILLIVAGIMISLSILELYPEIVSYNKKKNSVAGFIIGLIAVIVSILAL